MSFLTNIFQQTSNYHSVKKGHFGDNRDEQTHEGEVGLDGKDETRQTVS
jgi:hypothetical protein